MSCLHIAWVCIWPNSWVCVKVNSKARNHHLEPAAGENLFRLPRCAQAQLGCAWEQTENLASKQYMNFFLITVGYDQEKPNEPPAASWPEYHWEQQADAAAPPWTAPNHITWIFFKERQCFSLCTTFFRLVWLSLPWYVWWNNFSFGGKNPNNQQQQKIFSPGMRLRPQIQSILEELELAPFLNHCERNFQHWIACLHFWGMLASSWGWCVVAGIWKICCTGYLHVAYWAL